MICSKIPLISRTFRPKSASSLLSTTTTVFNKNILQSSTENEEDETYSKLKHHIKIDGETVEVMFTADWGKGLNSKQVEEEIKRFTEAMIRIKKEQRNDEDQKQILWI